MKTRKAGFTLIELLVVIAVIALLMAILMPALRKARENAKRVICSNQCRQIGVAVSSYVEDYDGWLPWYGSEWHPYAVYRKDGAYGGRDDKSEPPGVVPPIAYWDTDADKGVPMKLACLYEGDYIVKPEIFYCPSNRNPLYKYQSYIDPEPWGTLDQKFNDEGHNQWVRVGYTYYPTNPSTKKLSSTDAPVWTARKLIQLDQRIPYMTDIIRHKDQISHRAGKSYGINALFADGHVDYCTDQTVFDDPIWDEWEEGNLSKQEYMKYKFYYRIFSLIHTR